MALDSDGDDILYSSMDGEKSVSGSSDLTQAVEIAEQQRFIPNYNIDALGGKPMVVGLAGGTGSGKSTIMKIILEQTNSKDIGSHLLLQCLF
jgi:ABC-type multidrug transport system ATPase subunit